jgi:hypothetical protein
MSPGCQIDGKARHLWMDEEVEFETGESGTLHDVITAYAYQGAETDPSEEAARNLDWASSSRLPQNATALPSTRCWKVKRCGRQESGAVLKTAPLSI